MPASPQRPAIDLLLAAFPAWFPCTFPAACACPERVPHPSVRSALPRQGD